MEEKSDSAPNLSNTSPDNVSSQPQIKHDWYQTEDSVTITVLAKNCPPDSVKVKFSDHKLVLDAILPNGSNFNLTLNLSQAILPDKCTYKVFPSKIEIKLMKAIGERWSILEGEPKLAPSKSRNWDQVVGNLLKDDEQEGEAVLNSLFQKIYSEGSDEVKKAMNKSFLESGGTVLSTNWKEVGKDKVEMKPPDGVEFRKWDA